MVLLRNAGFVRGLALIVPVLNAGLAQAETSIDPTSGLLTLRETTNNGDARIAIDTAKLDSLWNVKSSVEIALPLAGDEHVQLDLTRFEVVRPGARFYTVVDGKQTATEPPRVLLLRGSIRNEPDSHVFLALTGDGGGSGSITRDDGRQLTIGTDAIDGRAIGLRIHSGAGDVPDFPNFCGTATQRVETPLTSNDTPGAGGTAQLDPRGPRVLVVALDGDESFVQLFPNSVAAQAYMIQLAGAVSDIYLRELNFRIWVDFIRTWDTGGEPFSAANLSGFRNYWIANEDLTGLNLVHMLSGRRDLAYGGIAFLADACNNFGFAISGFLLGSFPAELGPPHLGNWDVDVVAHEMGHNLGTPHTHDYEPPIDQCTSGVHERGTIMSYCHTNPGGLLNTDMRMHKTVELFIADNNTPSAAPCLFHDCNGNGIDDEIDIGDGWFDNNFNGIPDACEDCNSNGQLDSEDILLGAADVNNNGLLDICEPDCNDNNVPDAFEISTGAAADLNGSGIPDMCEPDCNGNGVVDFEDIRLGTHTDIDRNSVPDVCQDCNANGIVDWIDVDRQFNWFIAQGSAASPVREYHAASGVFVRTLGSGLIDAAYDLAFGPDRQLYVASYANNRIVKVNVDTGAASIFVASGAGGLASPAGLTFGPDGHLYVCSQATSSVLRYNGTTGAFMGVFVPSGSGGLLTPWGLTFGPNDNLFVISAANQVLQYNGTTGALLGVFIGGFGPGGGGNLNDPRDLVFLPNGQCLVTNRVSNVINRYNPTGTYVGPFNDNSVVAAPWGILLGTNGNVYAARTGGEVRVIEYDVDAGRYVRAFVRGDAGLTAPTAFAIRPASPNDADGDGLPDSCGTAPCPADVYPPTGGDGTVDIDDVLFIVAHWGATGAGSPGDINGDNTVGILDLLMAINNWGTCA